MVLQKGVRVNPRDAEKVKRLLKEQGVLDSKKTLHMDGVVFPIKAVDFDLRGLSYDLVETEFEDFKHRDGFERFLEKIGLPLTSYDVIGDIAILEIPEGFECEKKEIAKELLRSKKHVKAVFEKSSAVLGEERVRGFEWLSGEKTTETVHKEHGCEFKLDISKVFFSPRLSYERARIMNKVKDGEHIVDMFAGIGPYAIVIARHRNARVKGYDINKAAVDYFKENIRINRVGDRVEAILGDSRELASRKTADRTIMNLPKSARDYFVVAMDLLKQEGGVIHYYGESHRESPYEDHIRFISNTSKKAGKRAFIREKRVVRSYSPSEVHVAIDVEVQ